MNKFTKVGITALAGSLASFAANAASLDVTGSAKLTYMSQDSTEVTGNPLGMNTAISFVGSGEVNGYATTLTIVNNDANTGLSSASLAVDLGDLGKVYFDQGVGHGGISTIDDKTPTANEEVWDSLDAVVGTVNGLVGGGNSGVIVYANSYDGVNLSAQVSKGDRSANGDGASSGGTGGTSWDFALTSATLAPGLDAGVGYGRIANGSDDAGGDDTNTHMVVYANYTVGMATIGATLSEVQDKSTSTAQDEEGQGFGIALNVNDNLSVSYGEREVEHVNTGSANVTEDMTGYAIAYTMGSAKITLQTNDTANNGGTAGTDDKATELALMLTF
jgi:outer membrane protein OmpU